MSEPCYHCHLPVPAGIDFSVAISGKRQAMCCPGCQAIALAIIDGGLERFYEYRSTSLNKPNDDHKKNALDYFDLPEIQEDFVTNIDGENKSAQFIIKGISCSACAWLIENYLSKFDGIASVNVNVSQHRCNITWNQKVILLSDILRSLDSIGYQARPANDFQIKQQREDENKQALLRLGVAGLAMMQAGMVAIGLYAGDIYGIESQWQNLLRWISFVLVTPVVFYSARPFFVAAWRSIKMKHLVMDVPVSLAITLAYSASTWATITRSGEVYFDSVSMFTFFLLLGRYLEMRVRHKNEGESQSFTQLIPAVVTRIKKQTEEIIAVKTLKVGDAVRVAIGETIPCDGEIIRGQSDINEAALTGEQIPVVKTVRQNVSAGTINVTNPLEIRVQAINQNTRLATILNLADSSLAEKPIQTALADRLSAWFVAAVLIIAIVVGTIWWIIEPAKALWIVLSVLVVTCPCALSLATPAALTVATGLLRRHGFLIRKRHVLETLASINHCVFDKTGTLTVGNMRLVNVEPLSEVNQTTILKLAASLEKGSSHPIAKALHQPLASSIEFSDVAFSVGRGVSGYYQDKKYAIGKPAFVCKTLNYPTSNITSKNALLFANEKTLLAWIKLEDNIRSGAEQVLKNIRQKAIGVELLSGDNEYAVANLAKKFGISEWQADASPADKLSRIQQLQTDGNKVLMVGDGINDIPVLNAADVSVAMGDAADITQLHADSILVSGNLSILSLAIEVAQQCRRVIKQNLCWALMYNIVALPLACVGMVPPWAAAIGMSSSSLLVVLNVLRLNKVNLNKMALNNVGLTN